MAAVLNEKMDADRVSTHHLASVLDQKIKRSHLYSLIRGGVVMDLVEFLLICEALGLKGSEALAAAEKKASDPRFRYELANPPKGRGVGRATGA